MLVPIMYLLQLSSIIYTYIDTLIIWSKHVSLRLGLYKLKFWNNIAEYTSPVGNYCNFQYSQPFYIKLLFHLAPTPPIPPPYRVPHRTQTPNPPTLSDRKTKSDISKVYLRHRVHVFNYKYNFNSFWVH